MRSKTFNLELKGDTTSHVSVSVNSYLRRTLPKQLSFLAIALVILGPFIDVLSWLSLLLVPGFILTIYLVTFGSKHFLSVSTDEN